MSINRFVSRGPGYTTGTAKRRMANISFKEYFVIRMNLSPWFQPWDDEYNDDPFIIRSPRRHTAVPVV
ncbi:MAG: hypothetical protein ABI480_07620 [Chitinophagaceae bacterium]